VQARNKDIDADAISNIAAGRNMPQPATPIRSIRAGEEQ
jgi:hypothetical protein